MIGAENIAAARTALSEIADCVAESEILRRLDTTEPELAAVFKGERAPSPGLAKRLRHVAIFEELPLDPIHDHVAMIHKLAEGMSGKLIVASYGENPETGASIPPKVRHFAIGDVDGMVAAVRELGVERHRNVYVPFGVMRPELAPGKKGGIEDAAAVLGLVADFDDDRAAEYRDRLPLPANYVLETSAGRYQAFYLFADPLPPDQAAELGARLKTHAACDHGTADISHVWRVAGTLNRPNRKKAADGRPLEPQPVRVAEAWDGTLTDADELESALPAAPCETPAVSMQTAAISLAELPEDVRQLIVGGVPRGERSEKFHFVVASLKELGASAEAIAALLSEYPSGIAAKYRRRISKEVARSFDKTPARQPPQTEFDDWPEPFDMFGDASLTGKPVLDRSALPAGIADFAADAAERLGVELGMVAVPALAVCAGALHDGHRIQPKARDTSWKEHPALWFALVADPGGKKTPALAAALRPLRDIEAEWMREDGKAFDDFEQAEELYKASSRDRAKRRTKHKDADPELSHETLFDGEAAPVKPERPPRRRLIVGDATIEALAAVLADNARGVLAVFDELTGLFGSFDAYRQNQTGKDRSAWLELFNGGPRTIDRVSRGIGQHVPNWSASVLGGIQPEKMRQLSARLSDDGLLQRFLVFTGRTIGPGADREPGKDAVEKYRALIRALTALGPSDFNNPVRLSPAAQKHRARVCRIAEDMKLLPDTSGAMRGHLAKWDGIYARLLLVFHAVECVAAGRGIGDTVDGATAEKAARFMLEYALPNAARFYRDVIGQDGRVEHAQWIAGHVLSAGLREISMRDIYRAYRDLRDQREAIPEAMRSLELAGWARAVDPGRGKPVTKWAVNPLVHTVFAARAEDERARREHEKEKIRQAVARLRDSGGR